MSKEEKYNGWANWETWNVVLWAGNDEGLYNLVRERRGFRGDFDADSAEWLARDMFPMGTPDMITQDGKKSTELNTVNWDEVAEAWNEY